MSTIAETIAAGAVAPFRITGHYLRLQEGTGVTITFFRNGLEIAKSVYVSQGYAAKIPSGFDRFDVSKQSGAGIPVRIFLGEEPGLEIDYAGATGAVAVSSMPAANGTATQASAATGADAQVLAANTARRYLALQNIGSADVFFTIDGGTADSTGFKLSAGQMVVYDAWVPSGAIRAYSATAGTLAYAEG